MEVREVTCGTLVAKIIGDDPYLRFNFLNDLPAGTYRLTITDNRFALVIWNESYNEITPNDFVKHTDNDEIFHIEFENFENYLNQEFFLDFNLIKL